MKYISFAVVLFLVPIVFGTQVPPQAFCSVIADVESFNGDEADLRILEVLGPSVQLPADSPDCDSLYSERTLQGVTVFDSTLERNTVIEAVVTYMGDEFSAGYSVSEVEVLPDYQPETEVVEDDGFWSVTMRIMLVLLVLLVLGIAIILHKHRG